MNSSLKHTPLYDWHTSHGAKTADFGGWDMPIEYSGIVTEHTAVREAVGVFDVSHMGKVQLVGDGVVAWLNAIVASDLDSIEFGKAQYSMLLNASGGVVDDLIVYKLSANEIWIVPNASNADAVVAGLQPLLTPGIELMNHHNVMGIIAIQGPQSGDVVSELGIDASIEYMAATKSSFDNTSILVCRSGYTGEKGFEIIAPNSILISLWEKVVELGAVPCGLGARDTLRLEMGYPLHGHEITQEISPVEAGLSWAIGWNKSTFIGDAVIRAQKENGVSRNRVALRATERGIPRAEMNVLRDGTVVGVTTSGTFSPSLKIGIALALVDSSVKVWDVLSLDVRGRSLTVEVVKLPFVSPSTK